MHVPIKINHYFKNQKKLRNHLINGPKSLIKEKKSNIKKYRNLFNTFNNGIESFQNRLLERTLF